MSSTEKLYFYPLWLRIWHGFNALGMLTLIGTGLSMQSSVESGQIVGFNTIVNLNNVAGIIVALSYIGFFIGNLTTSNGKFYLIKAEGFFKKPIKQAKFYIWGMFHGEKYPYPLSAKRKFNPLQKYAYVMVMYFAVPLVIISGFALLFPEIIINENMKQNPGY